MRRIRWFVAGAVAGAGGSIYAKRKARAAAERYKPVAVVRNTGQAVQRRAGDVGEAVRAGRRTMQAREAELLADLEPTTDVPPEDREDLASLDDPKASRPEPARPGRRQARRRSRRA